MRKLLVLVQLSLMASSSWKMSPKPKTTCDVGTLSHLSNARLMEMEEMLQNLKAQMLTKCNVSYCPFLSISNPFDESKTLLGTYRRRKETSHIDCGRIREGDINYAKEIVAHRPVLVAQNLSMCCEDIRRRVMGPGPMRRVQFGVAHARIVSKHYDFIEEELRSSYHPQNHFCYAIEKEADDDFKAKIRRLASCFPNVIIIPEEFDTHFTWMSSQYIIDAYYSCMKLLSKRPGWEYMILLLNNDVVIKSPYEFVEIYKMLDGANDVEISRSAENSWNHSMKWDARSLKLFVNENLATPQQLSATLQFAKGSTQASLSRAAVEWLVGTVNLTTLLYQVNSMKRAPDELVFPSLQGTDEWDMPGRFTSECLKQDKYIYPMTRLSLFEYGQGGKCRTGMGASNACIFGLEDLQEISETPHLIVYKYFPHLDYGLADCVHELIFNRTFLGQVDHPLNLSYYSNLPTVKFHKSRKHSNGNYKVECD